MHQKYIALDGVARCGKIVGRNWLAPRLTELRSVAQHSAPEASLGPPVAPHHHNTCDQTVVIIRTQKEIDD
jgi:hypothetical protein